MTCEPCGERPKNPNRGFPKAVVEINNPPELVLFRKVMIPSSLGTEDDTPAYVGKYKNVLLEYESNGHIYLYSSDGIPTLLSADVDELAEQVAQLAEDLETEVGDRETAVAALWEAIGEFVNFTDEEWDALWA